MNYQNYNGYNNVPPPPPNYNYNRYPQPPKDNTVRTVLIVVGAVFAFFLFIIFAGAIFGGSDEKQTAMKSARPDTMTTAELSWCGRYSTDEMTDVNTYEAMMKSNSKDSDPDAMDICIKKVGKSIVVSLDVDTQEDHLTSVEPLKHNTKNLLVRKNDDKAQSFDYKQGTTLITSAEIIEAEKFINYIKDADSLRIQIGVGARKPILRFTPSNKLIWPPTPETYGDGNGDWKMM